MEKPINKILEMCQKRNVLLARLEVPVRALANAAKDAGLKASADPVLVILFEIDHLQQELTDYFKDNPEKGIDEFMALIMKGIK